MKIISKPTTKTQTQIVLRDQPNGMPLKTRVRAGFTVKLTTNHCATAPRKA